MKKFLTAASVAFAVLVTVPAYAVTSEADCKTMWIAADVDKSGSVAGDEAKAYIEALEKSGMKTADTDSDGSLTKKDFMAACQKDAFKDIKI